VPLSVEVVGGEDGSLIEKIQSGEALHRVVAYPWGFEFDVQIRMTSRPETTAVPQVVTPFPTEANRPLS
jgi:hypothetical protein